MGSRPLFVACLVISNLGGMEPKAAWAHEFWLAPSRYQAASRDTVTVRAFVGTGFRGELKPYASTRTVRFTMQGAQRVDLAPAVTDGELRWALYIPRDERGQIVSYQSDFAYIELPSERFDSYLETEGLDAPLAARRRLGSKAGPGRERYARCAKTWVAGSDGRRVIRPQRLALEIVPLADPERSSRLRVQVLHRGTPLPNALLRTWNQDLSPAGRPLDPAARDSVAPVQELRTARDGTATLDVREPGEWLVSVVHMVRSEARQQADWQSLWSSFTFARKARPR